MITGILPTSNTRLRHKVKPPPAPSSTTTSHLKPYLVKIPPQVVDLLRVLQLCMGVFLGFSVARALLPHWREFREVFKHLRAYLGDLVYSRRTFLHLRGTGRISGDPELLVSLNATAISTANSSVTSVSA